MKFKGMRATFLAGCVLSAGLAGADAKDSTHRITRWQGNHVAAVSLTFDDAIDSQLATVMPLLDSRDIKATFFLTTDWISGEDTWTQWQQAAGRGHELGNHTRTHAFLPGLSEEDVRLELESASQLIESYISPQRVVSMAYPFGATNDDVKAIAAELFVSARGVGREVSHYPDLGFQLVDFYDVPSKSIDSLDLGEIRSLLDLAETFGAWFSPHMHGLEAGEEEFFSEILDDILGRNVWIDTYGRVARYMQERVNAELEVFSQTDTEIELSLSHSLDPTLFDVPLTIRSEVPPGWGVVRVEQGSLAFTVKAVMEAGELVAYYDATPNAGNIRLTEAGPPSSRIVQAHISDIGYLSPWGSVYGASYFWSGRYGGAPFRGVFQFDLGKLPERSEIISASIGITGYLADAYRSYVLTSEGTWDLRLLSSEVDTGWGRHDFDSIGQGKVLSSIPPTLGNADLGYRVTNTFDLDAEQVELLRSRHTGRASFRLDGTTASPTDHALFLWAGAISVAPVLNVQYAEAGIIEPRLELSFERDNGAVVWDGSGNENHGVLDGARYSDDAAVGVVSLDFDGDDQITVRGDLSMRTSDLSVSLWVKHRRDTSDPNLGGILEGPYGNGASHGFRILDYNNRPLAQANMGDAGPIWLLGEPFPRDEWTHLVLTYDHEFIRLFQNGDLVQEIPESRDINWGIGDADMHIGWAEWFFDGQIDQVMIRGVALSRVQVQEELKRRGELLEEPIEPGLIFLTSNPTFWLDAEEFIAVVDPESTTTRYFPKTYSDENPDGWANPEGATFLGERLFLCGLAVASTSVFGVWEVDPFTGEEKAFFPTARGLPLGLASDGTDLFVSQYNSANEYVIYKFSPSGALLQQIDVPLPLNGLTYARGYLFGAYANVIVQIDPSSGSVVGAFQVPLTNVMGLDFVDGADPRLAASVRLESGVYEIHLDEDLRYTGEISVLTSVTPAHHNGLAISK